MTCHIVAIGPLPPPENGPSIATKGMIVCLSEANSIAVCNIGPPSGKLSLLKLPIRFSRALSACLQLFVDRTHGDRICYLACDGGSGLIYTSLVVLFARLLAYPVYLHHHSFNYIDRPKLLMRLILTLGGRQLRHIFPCDIMRDDFADTYGRRIRSSLISNAALVAPQEERDEPKERTHLVMGIFGILSREKGLDTFLDLARQARNENLPIKSILAGPAGASGRATIDGAVAELGDMLEYRGPLYDNAKATFYRELDVFVFPTTDSNDAHPLVIFEAKAAGNVVISCDRGCIRKQLDESDLLIPSGGDFIPTALAWFSAMAPEPALERRRKAIQQAYKTRHAKARAAVKALIDFDKA
ncbi:glycosyltransferase involved in cell wall biosynthesis [Rhizobium mesoamericanum]|uniref:glycosyltransferase family 4 protein n=1 Tax=Rhizobium mesoamericanum TaxID=1079800 RepID=UPI0027811128|nr:glycosyltransferase family 4 protein [Rhizobium mesoamericanum]MDQ0563806.1 glycosyltransferase involved in cell wall biosynthesis [Rhizobium mesoamericanum]